MRILILGGSPSQPGGVEAFCERSEQALRLRTDWDLLRMHADTAHMTVKRLPGLVRGWARLLGTRRLDCVWVQYTNIMDLTFVLVAKAVGHRVMVTPHLGSNWRSQANKLLRTISAAALRCADRLALISPTQELEIELPPAVPRSQIRNFLPATLLEPSTAIRNTPEASLQLIHSGRLSEGKGTFLFVDVCARLRDLEVPFQARITGGADQATYHRLNEQISGYGLRDQVTVLGRVSDSNLVALLRASDVLVHLSRIDSYPLIVLEAMLCGMFPVCMELAGARDMVNTYGGYVVSETNAAEETAAYLATHEVELLRRIGATLETRVRADYTWDRCAAAAEMALIACAEPVAIQRARSIQAPD